MFLMDPVANRSFIYNLAEIIFMSRSFVFYGIIGCVALLYYRDLGNKVEAHVVS